MTPQEKAFELLVEVLASKTGRPRAEIEERLRALKAARSEVGTSPALREASIPGWAKSLDRAGRDLDRAKWWLLGGLMLGGLYYLTRTDAPPPRRWSLPDTVRESLEEPASVEVVE